MTHESQIASDVIDSLGGAAATARSTGRNNQHVTWRASGRPPADAFVIVSQRLAELGWNARAALRRIVAVDAVGGAAR